MFSSAAQSCTRTQPPSARQRFQVSICTSGCAAVIFTWLLQLGLQCLPCNSEGCTVAARILRIHPKLDGFEDIALIALVVVLVSWSIRSALCQRDGNVSNAELRGAASGENGPTSDSNTSSKVLSHSSCYCSPDLVIKQSPLIIGQDLRGRVSKDTEDNGFPFARGGTSNIFRGHFLSHGGQRIPVALKIFWRSDERSKRRLHCEAELWARLNHKNVVAFLGIAYDIAPSPVLVSPLYPLGDIEMFLSKHPEANRPEIVLGVALGLAYLHGENVVHGDLKPQNVLVDEDGTPKICDFGISKIMNRRGFTTDSVGTLLIWLPSCSSP
ncbi:kinase-like domain-containing protein [Mycena alexandri]|uniref:Kinase-like domain-containing protein n=1 Tax=Mycena alexandri TaxID=1745969 RepID=A0AAD6RWS3_9AGAR|nr:kinase-like domain-containing protein [Mycena alexandri]